MYGTLERIVAACGNDNNNNNVKRERRTWTKEWGVTFCRKVLVIQPYLYSKGSKESAGAWSEITTNLCQLDGFAFTTKAIRDHHNGLINSRRAKVNAEVRETGTGTEEVPEIERLLDDIIADIDKYNEINADKNDARKAKETVEKGARCRNEEKGDGNVWRNKEKK